MRKRFVDGFHYDAHPMGMFVSAVAALGTFYADAKEIYDPESRNKQILRLIAKTPTIAAMCYRFSAGLPYNYPSNALVLPGQLPEHDVEDRRVRRAPGARAGDGCAVHPPRRPRAELRHHRDARRGLEPGRSVLVGGRGRACALRAAPRWRQRGRRADARRDRLDRQRPGVHRVGQGRRGSVDGLRPPRLQELRPPGDDHQADRVRGVRRHRQEPEARRRPQARRSRPVGPVLHRPQAVPQRRLLLRSHLRGDGVPGRHVHGAVRDPAHDRLARPLAGAASPTRTRRSRDRGSGSPAPASATT